MSAYTQKRDWDTVLDDAEGKFNADRAIAIKLAASLLELLPHAEKHIRALQKRMCGDLHPQLLEDKLDRAHAALVEWEAQ